MEHQDLQPTLLLTGDSDSSSRWKPHPYPEYFGSEVLYSAGRLWRGGHLSLGQRFQFKKQNKKTPTAFNTEGRRTVTTSEQRNEMMQNLQLKEKTGAWCSCRLVTLITPGGNGSVCSSEPLNVRLRRLFKLQQTHTRVYLMLHSALSPSSPSHQYLTPHGSSRMKEYLAVQRERRCSMTPRRLLMPETEIIQESLRETKYLHELKFRSSRGDYSSVFFSDVQTSYRSWI